MRPDSADLVSDKPRVGDSTLTAHRRCRTNETRGGIVSAPSEERGILHLSDYVRQLEDTTGSGETTGSCLNGAKVSRFVRARFIPAAVIFMVFQAD